MIETGDRKAIEWASIWMPIMAIVLCMVPVGAYAGLLLSLIATMLTWTRTGGEYSRAMIPPLVAVATCLLFATVLTINLVS